jgi:hypothetical protein
MVHAGVVSSGDSVESEAQPPVEKAPELEVPVALDTRVRSGTGRVRPNVGAHDPLVELLGEVEDVMVDLEPIGHSPGIVDVGDRAAPGVRCSPPELHRGTHDVVPLVAEQRCRHRRVHSAGEGYEDAHENSFSDGCDTSSIGTHAP